MFIKASRCFPFIKLSDKNDVKIILNEHIKIFVTNFALKCNYIINKNTIFCY